MSATHYEYALRSTRKTYPDIRKQSRSYTTGKVVKLSRTLQTIANDAAQPSFVASSIQKQAFSRTEPDDSGVNVEDASHPRQQGH
jgi:hypothetical protein